MAEVAIVGCGHGGSALAAVSARRGHAVRMIKLGSTAHNAHFQTLHARGAIRASGIEGDGEYPLAMVTHDPAEGLDGVDLVFVIYVTNHHRQVGERLAPYLRPGQCVTLGPGYMGSLLFERAIRNLPAGTPGQRSDGDLPLFVELECLPFSSRVIEPGEVRITSRNVRHPFAAYPASRVDEARALLEPTLGPCVAREHILEVALHNPNLMIHTVGTMMNVTRVENPDGGFSLYRQGFTPSMWNLVNALDSEKMDVMERVGAPRTPYFDAFRLRTFEDISIDPLDGFGQYASQTQSTQTTLEHRYITEDVPMGLGLLESTGAAGGVPTPVCRALIDIAHGLLPNHDFRGEARTLERIWDGDLDSLVVAMRG